MDSTMQHHDLTVTDILRHGARVHPASRVTQYRDGDWTEALFTEVADEAGRLAGALRGLGISADDVVGTLCWNTPAHLAAYFAVPGMGAVLHTLNLRLTDDQLVHIVDHAGDVAVIVDADLLAQASRILPRCPTVRHLIVVDHPDGPDPAPVSGPIRSHDYATLLAGAPPLIEWPQIRETDAAVLCYTTGTTGLPKGVAYSHRSIYLHTLAISTGSAYGFGDADRVMPIVPMFHATAWGWPYAAWLAGAELIMTGRYLQAEHLARIIGDRRPTCVAAVPTLWTTLNGWSRTNPLDLSTLRLAVSGGSPLPLPLAQTFARRHGVQLTQGWGMTETSPLLTFSRPPADTPADRVTEFSTRTGRLVPGVQARIVDESGREQPADGVSQGEVELRGPTITGRYFRCPPDQAADKFHDGWLRTGDLGVLTTDGWIMLKDRLKDGIKSGGEWISSIELEDALLAHPAVAEVVVIAVPDARWDERPLACVKLAPGQSVSPDELRAFLADRVARWWLPERWAFVDDIPRTSVGKLDKKRVREDYRADRISVSFNADAATPSPAGR